MIQQAQDKDKQRKLIQTRTISRDEESNLTNSTKETVLESSYKDEISNNKKDSAYMY